MEVVREKSLSPELRQNPERQELRGGERLRGFEGGGTSGNLERLGGRQLSESSAELPKRFIITKDQKSGEVRESPSSHIFIG